MTTGILHGMLKPPNLIVTKNLDLPIDSTAHTLNNRSIKQFYRTTLRERGSGRPVLRRFWLSILQSVRLSVYHTGDADVMCSVQRNLREQEKLDEKEQIKLQNVKVSTVKSGYES